MNSFINKLWINLNILYNIFKYYFIKLGKIIEKKDLI